MKTRPPQFGLRTFLCLFVAVTLTVQSWAVGDYISIPSDTKGNVTHLSNAVGFGSKEIFVEANDAEKLFGGAAGLGLVAILLVLFRLRYRYGWLTSSWDSATNNNVNDSNTYPNHGLTNQEDSELALRTVRFKTPSLSSHQNVITSDIQARVQEEMDRSSQPIPTDSLLPPQPAIRLSENNAISLAPGSLQSHRVHTHAFLSIHMSKNCAKEAWRWCILMLLMAVFCSFALAVLNATAILLITQEYKVVFIQFGEALARSCLATAFALTALLLQLLDARAFYNAYIELSQSNLSDKDESSFSGPPMDVMVHEDIVLAGMLCTLVVGINVTAVIFMQIEGWNFRDAEQWYIASISSLGFSVVTVKTNVGKVLLLFVNTLGIIMVGLILAATSSKLVTTIRRFLLRGIRDMRRRAAARKRRLLHARARRAEQLKIMAELAELKREEEMEDLRKRQMQNWNNVEANAATWHGTTQAGRELAYVGRQMAECRISTSGDTLRGVVGQSESDKRRTREDQDVIVVVDGGSRNSVASQAGTVVGAKTTRKTEDQRLQRVRSDSALESLFGVKMRAPNRPVHLESSENAIHIPLGDSVRPSVATITRPEQKHNQSLPFLIATSDESPSQSTVLLSPGVNINAPPHQRTSAQYFQSPANPSNEQPLLHPLYQTRSTSFLQSQPPLIGTQSHPLHVSRPVSSVPDLNFDLGLALTRTETVDSTTEAALELGYSIDDDDDDDDDNSTEYGSGEDSINNDDDADENKGDGRRGMRTQSSRKLFLEVQRVHRRKRRRKLKEGQSRFDPDDRRIEFGSSRAGLSGGSGDRWSWLRMFGGVRPSHTGSNRFGNSGDHVETMKRGGSHLFRSGSGVRQSTVTEEPPRDEKLEKSLAEDTRLHLSVNPDENLEQLGEAVELLDGDMDTAISSSGEEYVAVKLSADEGQPSSPSISGGPTSSIATTANTSLRRKKIWGLSMPLQRVHEWMDLHADTVSIGFVVSVTLFGGSALFWVIEYEVQHWSYLDALYFMFSLVSTTGYGDEYPKTGWGRTLVIVMVFVGLGCWAYAVSAIVARLQAGKVGLMANRIHAERAARKKRQQLQLSNSETEVNTQNPNIQADGAGKGESRFSSLRRRIWQ